MIASAAGRNHKAQKRRRNPPSSRAWESLRARLDRHPGVGWVREDGVESAEGQGGARGEEDAVRELGTLLKRKGGKNTTTTPGAAGAEVRWRGCAVECARWGLCWWADQRETERASRTLSPLRLRDLPPTHILSNSLEPTCCAREEGAEKVG